jgi:hypothetical protein
MKHQRTGKVKGFLAIKFETVTGTGKELREGILGGNDEGGFIEQCKRIDNNSNTPIAGREFHSFRTDDEGVDYMNASVGTVGSVIEEVATTRKKA